MKRESWASIQLAPGEAEASHTDSSEINKATKRDGGKRGGKDGGNDGGKRGGMVGKEHTHTHKPIKHHGRSVVLHWQ